MKTILPTFLFCLVLSLAGAVFKLTYDGLQRRAHPAPQTAQTDTLAPAADEAEDDSADDEEAAAGPALHPAPATHPAVAPAVGNPFAHRGPNGAAADHWTNYEDATDHVAAEILDALDDRPTLVVWLFDRTESAADQIDRVRRRFTWAYQKFDELKQQKHPAFQGKGEQPLVSVVGSFAKTVEFANLEPTDDTAKLIERADAIRTDTGSQENTFAAIEQAFKKFNKYRTSEGRLLLFVVVTDEVGDDAGDRLDLLVPQLRKAALPVYVIGPPAPFGLKTSFAPVVRVEAFKPVIQGPESLELETVNLEGWSGNWSPLDSGFGPFALTRLAVETGGQYLAVRPVTTYEPRRMAAYAPDYISYDAYRNLQARNRACAALVEAGRQPRIETTGYFETVFPKKDDAALNKLLTKAQQKAAVLEPKLKDKLYPILAAGEADRPQLPGLRWQAGYDLAMGRVLAMRSRVEGYNALLALLKAGKNFPDPKHTTWVLKPSNNIQGDSSLQKLAVQARKYLERVLAEHPETPWATQAARELATPLGWEWTSK